MEEVMNEMKLFQRQGFLFRNMRLSPVDVPGDGNCLFHALIASDKLPVQNHFELRKTICDFALSCHRTNNLLYIQVHLGSFFVRNVV